jgi:DNA (cytosine-5)-methyltransferase 1
VTTALLPTLPVLDLFAGPGGWDEGLRMLGITNVWGVEWDEAACATARAAGHRRTCTDVSKVPLDTWGRRYRLQCASPPCQGFSQAGSGEGRKDSDLLVAAIFDMLTEDPDVVIARLHRDMKDDRSVLVLEPLRWAIKAMAAGKPFDMLAWEQVPAVLPVWEACATVLQTMGYAVEARLVQAEQFGVPQTRKRAILRGTLDPQGLRPLVPTHSKYHNRTPSRLDPGVLPWVSMAQALQWGLVQRPSYTVVAGGKRADDGTGGHGSSGAEWGGSAARQAIASAAESGDPETWVPSPRAARSVSGPGREPVERTVDKPALTVTGGGRNVGFEWDPSQEPPEQVEYVNGTHDHAARRPADKPAPTVMFGHRLNTVEWQPTDAVGHPRRADGRDEGTTIDGEEYRARDLRTADKPAATITEKVRSWDRYPEAMGDVRNAHGAIRSVDAPAPTLTASMDNGNFQWVPPSDELRAEVAAEMTDERVNNQSGTTFDLAWPADRPAPTVAGREIVTMPGANANRFNGSTKSRNDGVRVTVQEAAVLQSFPADYPWQGTKTAQYRQVGDAVPPLLAAAIVRSLLW